MPPSCIQLGYSIISIGVHCQNYIDFDFDFDLGLGLSLRPDPDPLGHIIIEFCYLVPRVLSWEEYVRNVQPQGRSMRNHTDIYDECISNDRQIQVVPLVCSGLPSGFIIFMYGEVKLFTKNVCNS